MPIHHLFRPRDLPEDEYRREIADAFHTTPDDEDPDWLPPPGQPLRLNQLVTGRVLRIVGDAVLLDVGAKSEGLIPLAEWREGGEGGAGPPRAGDEVRVLLDAVEDQSGAVVLSYRKARRREAWRAFADRH